MNISVIIPTLNRQHELKETIVALMQNTLLPAEIIIVEQESYDFACAYTKQMFNIPENIELKVIYQSTKSIALARQRGFQESQYEIICFIDDDITLGETYLQNVVDFFTSHPNAQGVTGAYQRDPRLSLKKVIASLFGIYSLRGTNRVLASGSYDYVRGTNLKKVQIVEWLYGCNMVVRRGVLEKGIAFNPHFVAWSFGEDVDFSYQIHMAYPNSLFFLPSLQVVHREGKRGKLLNHQALRMKIIYRYIFWRTHVAPRFAFSTVRYIWSQVGLGIFECISYPSLSTIHTLFDSYRYLISHKKDILNNSIDYNAFILNK